MQELEQIEEAGGHLFCVCGRVTSESNLPEVMNAARVEHQRNVSHACWNESLMHLRTQMRLQVWKAVLWQTAE